MKYNQLGRTGIKVSELCLGSMTWGSQNTQAEANAQLDYSFECGINFIDTAEMYPTTPRRSETTGLTEEIIGNWISARSDRDKIILASKVTGEGNKDIRNGARVTGAVLRQSLEGSLKRLKTDYIDLFQLHWPNRGSYHFRKYWTYDPRDNACDDMDQEVTDILGEVSLLQKEGKIREFGLSNESAWGTMKFLQVSEKHALPRIVSMQNEYSLICRIYDLDMAEVSFNENVGLLAFSPLAAGALSGKYLDGSVPQGSRLSIQNGLNGRYSETAAKVIAAYSQVAKNHAISLTQMSLAFCLTRSFMTSVIIGATCMDQLKENIGSAELVLGSDVLEDIQKVYRAHPRPM